MTDLYPSEEGYISDGNVIGFCKVQAEVELHEAVFIHGTAVSGEIMVAPAAADGDGCAVTLKAGVAGDHIPVCFFGVVKLMAGAAIDEGDQLKNDSLGTYLLPIDDRDSTAATELRGLNYTGTGIRLGVALQAGASSGDELLVLVGRTL